jgi:N-acetylglucosaminyl-diphospho-decaprenol L-rhamnosyltransferase
VTASVHVVIVNWNTGDYLRRCLASIAGADLDGLEITRVTVIDNNSSDDSLDDLDGLDLPLELVRKSHNSGFAAACNEGAAGSTADYLLFLNPDTELFPDTLSVTTRFMESARAGDVGICGTLVVDEHQAPTISCARFPTLRIMFGKMTGLHHVAPSLFPTHHLDVAELDKSRAVDQVIGAFYLVRRGLFELLGGFDTRFFLYFEEVDFAMRARRHGFRSHFLREARVQHAENVSSRNVPAARLYHSLRSRSLFAYKHWSRGRAHALVLLTLTVELTSRLARAALSRDWSQMTETLRAYRRIVGDLLRGPARARRA